MNRYKHLIFMSFVVALSIVAWSLHLGIAESDDNIRDVMLKVHDKVTTAERKAAAERFKAAYDSVLIEGAAVTAVPNPGGIPHYFGPYPNYANSPLPAGAVTGITLDTGGTGYTAPTVDIVDVYGTPGAGGAAATATVDPVTGAITGIVLTSGGSGYIAPRVIIMDPTGIDAAATATMAGGIVTGGIRKFVDALPGLGPTGANLLGQYIPVAVADSTTYAGSDYYEIALVQYTEQMHSDLPLTLLRGYVQLETAVIKGKHVPLTVNGNIVGYAVDDPHYLGPLIIAKTKVPVRVKFHNFLPTGLGGDLFLPVDTTVMGAGMGPDGMTMYTQNRATVHLHGNNTVWISDGTPHQWTTPAGENTPYPEGVSVYNVPDMDGGTEPQGTLTFYYTNQQSARLMFYHDHAYGITRLNVYAGEAAGYLLTDPVEQDMIKGTNASGVNPDLAKVLPDVGIPLIIQDKSFVDTNTIGYQDPTWNSGSTPGIPQAGDLWYPHVYMPNQNPWDISGMNAFGRWHYGPWFWPPTVVTHGPVPNPYYDCGPGGPCTAPWEPPLMPGTPDLSMAAEAFMDTPLVNGTVYPYLVVEPKTYRFRILNAADDRFFNLQLYLADGGGGSGATATAAVDLTPGSLTYGQVTAVTVTSPGTGYAFGPSIYFIGGSGQGAAAKATVDPLTGTVTAVTVTNGGSGYISAPMVLFGTSTEVKMVPAVPTPGFPADWPTDGREGGVPDPTTAGPSFIQIGTEGGFMPAPVVLPNQPVLWNFDQTNFDFGNVKKGTLILGTAERADVILDFSAFAGKTLILYNDSPAPFPAIDPRYDYYTGNPDHTDIGGAPSTLPSYGPNTRTIMQIRVKATPVRAPYDLAALQRVFAKTATKRGVFEVSQETIIVPEARYNSAYNGTFPADPYVRIMDTTKTFTPIGSTTPVTLPLQPKALQDEMGEAFDTDYGRMSAMLGLELPKTFAGAQNFMLYPFLSPPVEILKGTIYGTPIGLLNDGTQIWKITHNGVDTHTIHTHLFNVQIINRVAWDNAIRIPDPNELGWKETFRVNPLQDIIIALRPTIPRKLPFKVPNSVRLIDPTQPEGVMLMGPPGGFFDPSGEPVEVMNHFVNFGWEYMYHCHILAHEEMDMMHSVVVAVPPEAPTNLTGTLAGGGVTLTWNDNSLNETSFAVQRANDAGFTTGLAKVTVGPDLTTYIDTTVRSGRTYYYRVFATNTVGDTTVYPAPAIGFPTLTVKSTSSNQIGPITP